MNTPLWHSAIEAANYEADDLIAAYAREAVAQGLTVRIVSADKDLMQLVRPSVELYDPMKAVAIGPAEVEAKFGVPPNKVIDVQALAGDSTDNVPGVPGIGVKTAAQLILEYGDRETLLARASEIKQPKRRELLTAHAEQARISKRLCDAGRSSAIARSRSMCRRPCRSQAGTLRFPHRARLPFDSGADAGCGWGRAGQASRPPLTPREGRNSSSAFGLTLRSEKRRRRKRKQSSLPPRGGG